MQSINVLLITEKPENEQDLVKIAEDATSYFPTHTWDDIRYLGKVSFEHDVQIKAGGKTSGAFLFKKLTDRIREMKNSNRSMSLLLGITPDPVVAMYYFFDGNHLKRALYLVHDYVTDRFGIVSLFWVSDERSSSKVVAHGLGHSRGLRHHLEPIDIMYSELLKAQALEVEGFCRSCLNELARKETQK